MSQFPPPYEAPQAGYSQRPPSDQGGRIKPPAICLIVVGSLSVLLFGLGCFSSVFELMSGGPYEPNALTGEPQTETDIVMGLVFTIGILAPNIAVILGGVQMLKQRGYGLAMTGAIIAVIPCISPCCVVGIPFGIWALVVLMNQDVKAAFR